MLNDNKAGKTGNTAPNGAQTATYVNKKLLVNLRSALKKGANNFDSLPSDREIIDHVVREMSRVLIPNPIYSKVVPGVDDRYKYFDSDVHRAVVSSEGIKDKGRFIDACIIAYLFGEVGISKWCVSGRVIYPQKLDQNKLHRIATSAAAIAAANSVESVFEPLTLPLDQE